MIFIAARMGLVDQPVDRRQLPEDGSTSVKSVMSKPWSSSGERKNGPTQIASTPSVPAR